MFMSMSYLRVQYWLVALGLWSVQWTNPPSNFSKGSGLS